VPPSLPSPKGGCCELKSIILWVKFHDTPHYFLNWTTYHNVPRRLIYEGLRKMMYMVGPMWWSGNKAFEILKKGAFSLVERGLLCTHVHSSPLYAWTFNSRAWSWNILHGLHCLHDALTDPMWNDNNKLLVISDQLFGQIPKLPHEVRLQMSRIWTLFLWVPNSSWPSKQSLAYNINPPLFSIIPPCYLTTPLAQTINSLIIGQALHSLS
jgi:hypothetical protein